MRGGTGYDGPDGGAVAFDDERVDRVSDLRDVHLPWRWGRLPLLGDDALRRRVVEQATDLGVRVAAWTVDDPAQAVRTMSAAQLHDLEVG